MTEKELIDGNELIADFLDLDKRVVGSGGIIYRIPNDLIESDDQSSEIFIDEFWFDQDWNWIHYLWDELHRKVCIPMIKDNKHLRFIRPIIQETKKTIVWGHKKATYLNMVKLIKLYNSQFE